MSKIKIGKMQINFCNLSEIFWNRSKVVWKRRIEQDRSSSVSWGRKEKVQDVVSYAGCSRTTFR